MGSRMADDKPAVLTDEEVDIVLQRLPGWAVDNGQLAKEFLFRDFVDALGFVNRLVPFFELKDHHPDVHIFYNRVKFELSRHDIGGKITSLDGEVAKRIEHEYGSEKR
jgi:4a-hydroxytetrahydrobiopterin dehydratase